MSKIHFGKSNLTCLYINGHVSHLKISLHTQINIQMTAGNNTHTQSYRHNLYFQLRHGKQTIESILTNSEMKELHLKMPTKHCCAPNRKDIQVCTLPFYTSKPWQRAGCRPRERIINGSLRKPNTWYNGEWEKFISKPSKSRPVLVRWR